jgi:hypothetical protein
MMSRSSSVPQPRPKRHRRSLRLLLQLLALIVVLGLVAYNRQGISDALALRGYQAPATVAAIATSDTMTDQARRVFYVNQPDIADKASFAKQCPSGNEQTVVLGCYHGFQDGIYVLAVSDSRLSGIEEVTSAHEMLHAAYDRLSSRQKTQIDAELTDYFNHGLKDATVKAQIESYKKTEPGELVNEMHSILGTEIPNLPAGLEAYYSRYFTNRAAVTDFYAKYEGEFTSRQAAIKVDDAQLTTLKAQIESAEAALKSQAVSLQSQEAEMNSLRASSNAAAYNARVPMYNAAIDSYNAGVVQARQLVNQYNALVNSRNSIALEAQQLTNEITSTVSPIGN